MAESELGFHFEVSRTGSVDIFHNGRLATTLRNKAADQFLAKVSQASNEVAQQVMARATGNYKRGNERNAKNHPRNR